MKKAVVIGIDQYPSGAELHACVNDASAVATLLETNADGSPNFDVKTYLNVRTRAQMKQRIEELFTGEVDTALFYFSGHGSLNMYGGYLVTPDFSKQEPGVSMNDILMMANNSEAKNKIIILDCCHSGSFGSTDPAKDSTTQIIDGVSILTASRPTEAAIEKMGHGVFTNLLLSALQGGASDLNGNITTGSVYAYIDQALGAWDQRPIFKTNVSKFIPIRTIHPPVSRETLRKITSFFPNPQDEFALDPSYEFSNASSVKHKVIKPHADAANVAIFKELQELQKVGLVVPKDAPYMYYAAMESKSCKLTALGYHYWRLVNNKRI
jgi:hypothetical protein